LSGTIRDAFDSFEVLEFADYSNNRLTGLLPASIFDVPTIMFLYFSNNILTGFIPDNFGNAVNLEDLFLNNNELSGMVPSIIPGQLENLSRLLLEINMLSGTVPASICALRIEDVGTLDALTTDCGGSPPEIRCADDCCTACFVG
jgi:hypothetical protein